MRMWVILIGMVFVITPSTALLNPAVIYCESLGYNHTVETTEYGDRDLCVLPNGQTVDAWEFLQGKVAQDYSYCKKMGYEIKTVKDSKKCMKFMTEECAVCVLPDGREVEVTELMNLSFKETVCGDGTCGFPENYNTCPKDCPSGEIDDYCDGVKDGKCDPDCSTNQDPDCVTETKTPGFVFGLAALGVVIATILKRL